MSNKNIVLVAAIGAAVVLVMKKQAAPAGAVAKPGATVSRNVNGDMWGRLLGTGWKNLMDSAALKSAARGFDPFVMSDGYGGLFTSDGVPVSSGDPLQDFVVKNTGLPALYDDTASYTTGDWVTAGVSNPLAPATFSDSIKTGAAAWGLPSVTTGLGSLYDY